MTLRSITESEESLQGKVEHLLIIGRWAYYHTWRSDHSVAGFPDIIAIRGTRLLAIELKSSKGTLTPAQIAWGHTFTETGKVEYYCWYPEDWDEIVNVLEREA